MSVSPMHIAEAIDLVQRCLETRVECRDQLNEAQRNLYQADVNLANAQNHLGKLLAASGLVGADYRIVSAEAVNAVAPLERPH